MDMGVLSIIGLGDGRGVILCTFLRPSASFSFSHCSAILPQSTAEELLPLGLQEGEEVVFLSNVGKNAIELDGCLAPPSGSPIKQLNDRLDFSICATTSI